MLKSILNYFWNDPGTDLSLDEAYSVLETDNETSNSLPETCNKISLNECLQKSGTITSAKGDTYTIDDVYTFKSNVENYQIGMKVSFIVYTSEGELRISNVTVYDDWGSQDITPKTWCHRCLICKVTGRDKRQVILSPNDLKLNLDEVPIEFIPIIGDWLEVEAKVELNENVLDLSGKILEIDKVRPLRPQIVEGFVKKWESSVGTGVIDRTIFFSKFVLPTGYIPMVGDKVVAEVIESDQEMYTKRALKVMFQQLKNKSISLKSEELPKFDTESMYVQVSDDLFLTSTSLGVTKKFEFLVENVSEKKLILSRIAQFNSSQCVIEEPGVLNSLTIEPGQKIAFKGTCTMKNMGLTKELVIFEFEDFVIGRFISTRVETNSSPNVSSFNNKSVHHTRFTSNSSNVIRGQRLLTPPRFIAKRLPDYSIPQKLLEISDNFKDVEFTEKIISAKPSLTCKLQHNIYEDRFHSLLHLEELAQLQAMKNYNQDLAIFINSGEFLILEIENLGEKRPSLIVGDRIIAKSPHIVDAEEYEGYIHKIQANHVFLKFSQTFHEEYNGEDVSIMAIASRSAYRRMHQAIAQAIINLRQNFLFPNKVNTKKPQIDLSNVNNEDFRWFNPILNYYQKEAVRNVLIGIGRPLPYLIYGPPGTGKTVTLVETVLQTLILMPHSRIIVATPSNSAANLVAVRLINSGILKPGDLIRLVGYQYFSQDMLPIELIPYAATADITKIGTYDSTFNDDGFKSPKGLNSTAIGRHRITVATCSALGSLFTMGFPKGHFTHIVIDEAGQTTEPEIMIPLCQLDVSIGQVILAGDPCQLGPTILSKVASMYGLEETYLDRMLDRYPYIKDMESFPKTGGYNPQFVTKLVYNYRSLPDILKLPSMMFYNDQLIPTVDRVESEEASLLERLKPILPVRKDSKTPAIVFHGVLGENTREFDSPSWYNANEASQVFYYINELYRMGVKNTEIGVISPYVKQVKLIRSLLNQAEFDLPKLGTVEEFQGHEYGIILLTTVRSSADLLRHDLHFNLGFVSNSKRLNVAITRAKSLMIIVGNPYLLIKDHHWRNIIKYCVDEGAYCGCDLPNYD
ncbi:hypothetical protein FQR65_LT03836 [Abscondita terminalis]|nr:hypothetical protein FQR65_LT03836 [Abscondita terminalis]